VICQIAVLSGDLDSLSKWPRGVVSDSIFSIYRDILLWEMDGQKASRK